MDAASIQSQPFPLWWMLQPFPQQLQQQFMSPVVITIFVVLLSLSWLLSAFRAIAGIFLPA
jgi:hypothetical protein